MVDFYKYLFNFNEEPFDESWLKDSSRKFENIVEIRKFSISGLGRVGLNDITSTPPKKDLLWVGFTKDYDGFFFYDCKRNLDENKSYLVRMPIERETPVYWFGIPLTIEFIDKNRDLLKLYRVHGSQINRNDTKENVFKQTEWAQSENERPIDDGDLDMLIEMSRDKHQLLTNLRGYIQVIREKDVIIDPYGLPYDVSDPADQAGYVLGKIHRMLPEREIKKIVNE